ncbi:MAG: hypothetical protein M1820_001361 [Bogoriella megaspora]|nr:MAG: hypothetical protein M1820_001361 [Bogoriella megaspora]
MSSHHASAVRVRGEPHNANKRAPGEPPSGTAVGVGDNGDNVPKLFQPLKLRGLTLQNRIMLAPLCQYSAEDGHHTDWHLTHLGGIIQRGPGISFIEATAVTPEGRITPEDSGLWKDAQIAPLKRIVDFAHSQGQKIGIQIAHAGRKASTVAPWLSSGELAGEELNGWPNSVYGPSAIPWNEKHAMPHAMTLDDIQSLKVSWVAAVRRALTAGFDAVEVHAAHGYLLHEFMSGVANERTDQYGGSFENRIRLALEIVDLTRAELPSNMPLFVRISATDWLDDVEEFKDKNPWTVKQSVELAKILSQRGVDLLDVSSGGNSPKAQMKSGPGYQVPFAKEIKKAVGDAMAIGTVGLITSGIQANDILEGKNDGQPLDLAIAGRGFQKNPGLVAAWADELGIDVQMANQIRWGFAGRGKKGKAKF